MRESKSSLDLDALSRNRSIVLTWYAIISCSVYDITSWHPKIISALLKLPNNLHIKSMPEEYVIA